MACFNLADGRRVGVEETGNHHRGVVRDVDIAEQVDADGTKSIIMSTGSFDHQVRLFV